MGERGFVREDMATVSDPQSDSAHPIAESSSSGDKDAALASQNVRDPSSSSPNGPSACSNSSPNIPRLLREFERRGFRRVYSPNDITWKRKFFKNLAKDEVCQELGIPSTPSNFRAITLFWRNCKESWLSRHSPELAHYPESKAKRQIKNQRKAPPATKTKKPLQPANRSQRHNPSGLKTNKETTDQRQSRSIDREDVPRPNFASERAPHPESLPPWVKRASDLREYPIPPPGFCFFDPQRSTMGQPRPPLLSNPPLPFPEYAAYAYLGPQTHRLGQNPFHMARRSSRKRDRDEMHEQSVALSKARENVEKEIDMMLEKQKTMSKVQKLKDRLRDKTASLPASSDDVQTEPEGETEQMNEDVSIGPPGSKWHLNADIQLSTEDYRLVGAGVVSATTSDDHEPVLADPASVAVYSKTTEESDKATGDSNAQPRIAKAPQWKDVTWWQERAKKARLISETREIEDSHIPIRKRLRPSSPGEDPVAPIAPVISEEDRTKYENMVRRLKETMVKSKHSDLTELVDCPSSMKRVLMSKLFNEHRDSISQRLDKLRFNGKTYQSDSELQLIKDLEQTALELEEVNLEALPDSFVHQIERFIMQEKFGESNPEESNGHENPEEADEEIVEVPVPPRPPVLLIDLDTDTIATLPVDENSQREFESFGQEECPGDNPQNGKEPRKNVQDNRVSSQVPVENGRSLDDLLKIHLEEESLLLQNRKLCDELRKNNDRLQYLRELRIDRLAMEKN